ncbi:GlxA family transcriptional regulator [Plantibacter sp. YIM 135347]|uniref:GlxA family transcriptional regulator n=1 Tax=Plantibacter sp. YIM 135347 TaxID=3423919 RepID=UPI003D33B253
MLEKVALLAIPGLQPFEFSVVCEVFGIDRSEHGGPTFDLRLVTKTPGPVRMNLSSDGSRGFDMIVENDLSFAAEADLVAVTGRGGGRDAILDPAYIEVLRAAEARGAWILSVCSGSFALGHAGLLDGRRSTTHWMYTDEQQRLFPQTTVDPNVLFIEDRRVITGAGTAAGIDACLHLVRREHGAAAANVIARRMVVPPQREGGQAQYILSPVPQEQGDSLAGIVDWMLDHLADDLTVTMLARQAHMSERTFARRFRAELGSTPAAWLNRQRLIRAQELLEQTERGIEQIAAESGFGTAAVLRHHFDKVLGTTPVAYRRSFGLRTTA